MEHLFNIIRLLIRSLIVTGCTGFMMTWPYGFRSGLFIENRELRWNDDIWARDL